MSIKMSEYGIIEFLEEYIEALKKPIRFKYTNEDKIEMLKQTIELINKQHDEIEELEDKNKTLEQLLQGNLYEMYKYYRELANSYQANCISKDKIKELIKEKAKTDTYNFRTIAVKDIEELLGE